jgi:hypothetical protein
LHFEPCELHSLKEDVDSSKAKNLLDLQLSFAALIKSDLSLLNVAEQLTEREEEFTEQFMAKASVEWCAHLSLFS